MDAVYSTVGLVVCWVAAYGVGSFVLCLAASGIIVLLERFDFDVKRLLLFSECNKRFLQPLYDTVERLFRKVFNQDAADFATMLLLAPILFALIVPLMLIEGLCIKPIQRLMRQFARRSHMEGNPNVQ